MLRFLSKLVRSLPFLVLLAAIGLSCVSRYKINLYQSIDETRRKTKIEEDSPPSHHLRQLVSEARDRGAELVRGYKASTTTHTRPSAAKPQPQE